MGFFGIAALVLAFWLSPLHVSAPSYQQVDRPEQQGGKLVEGRFGRGFISESKGDRILVPTAGNIVRERGTISFWVRLPAPPQKLPEWGALLTAQVEPYPSGKGFNPFQLNGLIIQYTEHTHKLLFILGKLMSFGNVLTVNKLDWHEGEDHQIAVSWGEQGMHIYIDGREAASNSHKGSISSLPRAMAIGSYAWDAAAQPSRVIIDDVMISDKQRSPDEIASLYSSGKPAIPDGDTTLLMSFDRAPVQGAASQASQPSSPTQAAQLAALRGPKVEGGRFVEGKFGRGYLPEKPGDMIVFPTAGNIRLDRGTIEMWVKPVQPPKERPDWAALFSMLADDLSPTNIRGMILTYVDNGNRLVFSLGKLGDGKTMVASPKLNWAANETHYVAASWGDQGMKLYIDGQKVGQNNYRGTLPTLPPEMALGSHIWEIVRRPADNVFDDFRISDEQRSDDEIRQRATASSAVTKDAHTMLLATFDDEAVALPVKLVGTRPLNIFNVGEDIALTIPADRVPASLRHNGSRVKVKVEGGTEKTIAGTWSSQGLRLSLGRADQLGFSNVQVTLENLPTVTSYYWVAPSLPDQNYQTSIFGVGQFGPKAMDDAYFAAAGALGVKWLRVPFDWAIIEPERGQENWETFDRIVNMAHQNGIHIMGSLFWEEPLPAWQGKSTEKTNKYPPHDLQAWSDHVKRVASHYKGKVDAWDPWNEPNLPGYWYPKPDPKAYVDLLKATSTAIKSVDPNAIVVGCGLSEIDENFYQNCIKLGALQYSDAIGVHPYIFPSSPDDTTDMANLGGVMKLSSPLKTTWEAGLKHLEQMLTSNGFKGKLWVTELGQHTRYLPGFLPPGLEVSEQRQADYLAKFFIDGMASGVVDRIFWFSFWGSSAGSFAIVNEDGTPKPAAVAYRTLVSHLANARLQRAQVVGGGTKIYEFSANGKTTFAVWSPRGTVTIKAESKGSTSPQVFNLMGGLEPVKRSAGGITFSVNDRPVLIEGASAVALQ